MLVLLLYIVLIPWAIIFGTILGWSIGWIWWWYELQRHEWRIRKLQRVEDSWVVLISRLEGMLNGTKVLTKYIQHGLETLCKAQKV